MLASGLRRQVEAYRNRAREVGPRRTPGKPGEGIDDEPGDDDGRYEGARALDPRRQRAVASGEEQERQRTEGVCDGEDRQHGAEHVGGFIFHGAGTP